MIHEMKEEGIFRRSELLLGRDTMERMAQKRVILFGDVPTTGRSFVQLADNLMDAGATQVVGFFLGKTDY